ncbi:MAG: hypothetical protein GY814_01855 [Gammaproteobacteria bacterium]|nr:hypothetical protein [Gammaproteobacteria bacterium]
MSDINGTRIIEISPYKRAAFSVGVLLLLLGMAFSLTRAVSGAAEQLIQAHLDLWAVEKGQGLSLEKWENVESMLGFALVLNPNNPVLLQQGGRLFEWGAWLSTDDNRARNSRLDRALEYYRASARQRPVWPYAWNDLAAAKLKRGGMDAEFRFALWKSLELGPWEKGIQLSVVEIGFANLEKFNREERKRLLENMRNATLRHAKTVAKLATKYHRNLLFCFGVTDNPWVTEHCRKKKVKN